MTNNDIIWGFDDERDDSLKIVLKKVNDRCLVLFLDGYIDTYNSLYFQSRVSKAIVAGFLQLIFDCEKLTYISSTGKCMKCFTFWALLHFFQSNTMHRKRLRF